MPLRMAAPADSCLSQPHCLFSLPRAQFLLLAQHVPAQLQLTTGAMIRLSALLYMAEQHPSMHSRHTWSSLWPAMQVQAGQRSWHQDGVQGCSW